MHSVIKQLFLGTLHLSSSTLEPSSEYSKKAAALVSLEEKLEKNLPKEEQMQLLELCDLEGELCSIEVTDSFVDGFRLGALFMQDIMYKFNNYE